MGDFDVPAVLDYVIKETGHSKVAVVAHSMGTTQIFFSMAHQEEVFADKVSIFIALGPVTNMEH
jgi:lysosomal acid lipase/cholesteryl ester hydrolase